MVIISDKENSKKTPAYITMEINRYRSGSVQATTDYIVKPHPLSLAVKQALKKIPRTGLSTVMALSMTMLATPVLAQPAVVELSKLDGSNGFVLSGVNAPADTGRSVSVAGDINGDGIDDLIIGAPRASLSFVVFGGNGVGASGMIDLPSLDGNNGFTLGGLAPDDSAGRAGSSVSGAGDVNGDGIDDLIIGAPFASLTSIGPRSGSSYVVFGGNEVGMGGLVDLSVLDGSNGFVLNGANLFDYSGSSVSAAGDINGDGIDDLVIGAPGVSKNGQYSGASYVVFGGNRVGATGVLELSMLDGSNGFVLNGVNQYDSSGSSVSAAGDINGDGIDDLIIGSNNSGLGISYVVFGGNSVGTTGVLELSTLDGSNGFTLNGVALGDSTGRSVGAAGDINGDGIDDLIIGAPDANRTDTFSFDGTGASYVVFGGTEVGVGGVLELSNLDGSNGFILNGVAPRDKSGFSVSAAGDVNGDGIDDLIIGAPCVYSTDCVNGPGASYVVFGGSEVGKSGVLELASLDGSNGFALNGVDEYDNSGISVSAAGDINGDGVDDVIVGAYMAGVDFQGSAYVVFGEAQSINQSIDTLMSQVEALGLKKWVENYLFDNLKGARKYLTEDRPVKAVKLMKRFINTVNALSGRQIKPADAQALIASARLIIGAIEAEHSNTVQRVIKSIDLLTADIEVLGLEDDLEDSFLEKLSKTRKKFIKGQTEIAVRLMNGFIKQVMLQSGKKITPADASVLIAPAEHIIEII